VNGKLKLRLIVDVEYELNGEAPDNLVHDLKGIVSYAMDRGFVTGMGPATVESLHVEVVDVPDSW